MDNQHYQEMQRQEAVKKATSDATENIMSFLKENGFICNRALEYYQEYESNKKQYIASPVKKTAAQFEQEMKKVTILVITVNPIENGVFIHWLSDKASCPLHNYIIDRTYYRFATINNMTIIHVNPDRTGEEYTRRLLNKVRKIIIPDYIFMLGICYGLADMKKYPIGSVFASKSIQTYRLNFRDKDDSDEIFFEAEDELNKSPDDGLIDTVGGNFMCCQTRSVLDNDEEPHIARTEAGKFLSSNSLMDSRKVKQAVLDQYGGKKPKPLGGEMEGAGILKSYFVEEDGFKNWMMIKSICDWGEKKNNLDSDPSKSDSIKDSLQAYAMTTTCGAFENILSVL